MQAKNRVTAHFARLFLINLLFIRILDAEKLKFEDFSFLRKRIAEKSKIPPWNDFVEE